MEGCIRAANFVSSEATMSPFSLGLGPSKGKSHASLFTVLRTAQAPRVRRSGLSQTPEVMWFFLFRATFSRTSG